MRFIIGPLVAIAILSASHAGAQVSEREAFVLSAGPAYSPDPYGSIDRGGGAFVASLAFPPHGRTSMTVGILSLGYHERESATFFGIDGGPRYYLHRAGGAGLFVEALPTFFEGTWENGLGTRTSHVLVGVQEGGGIALAPGSWNLEVAVHYVLSNSYTQRGFDSQTVYPALAQSLISLRVGFSM